MKPIRRFTANEFHVWQRKNLPRAIVIQDLDAWAVVYSNSAYEPLALIELKRSFLPAAEWRPYAGDRRNLAALLRLAERAGLPLFIVYWREGKPIADDDLFHVFELTRALPEYAYRERLVTARAFAACFPIFFPEVAA